MTQPFFVIVPTEITDSNLISTNVPENDYPVWDSITNYLIGDRVIVTTGFHTIYEAVQNNTNVDPTTDTLQLTWAVVGPTNAWAMFDQSGNTITSNPTSIEVVVSGDRITDFGFQELLATSVRLQAYNATEGTYYDQTFDIYDEAVVDDWYDYFFTEISRTTELIIRGVPPIGTSEYTITITSDVNAEIGTFVIGQAVEFGNTQYGARASIIDYSKKEVDSFGKVNLVQGNFSKKNEVTLMVDNAIVDSIFRKLVTLRGTANLWVGSNESFEMLSIYGFYRDFSIDIAYPQKSLCTLTIEGLN